MRFFSIAAILAVSALSSFVNAAPQATETSPDVSESAPAPTATSPTEPPPAGSSPNPISNPTAGTVCKANEPCTIEWEPTTDGTVTLKLRKGSSTNLDEVETIIKDTPNSGSYTWTPDEDLEGDDTYAIQIVGADGNSNYSPQFTIDSEGTGVSSSVTTSVKSTTTSAPSSTITSVVSTSTVTSATSNGTTTTGTKSTSTSKPKPTLDNSDDEDSEDDEAPNPNGTGAASGLLAMHSPMALILCVGAAMAYLS